MAPFFLLLCGADMIHDMIKRNRIILVNACTEAAAKCMRIKTKCQI